MCQHREGVSKVFENGDANRQKLLFFPEIQRRWDSKPLERKRDKKIQQLLEKSEISPEHILPHNGYLQNLGNADKEKRERSLNAFIHEMKDVTSWA